MKKVYLVYYYGGDFEEDFEEAIFVTLDIEVAKKYVEKFNVMLERWKKYYLSALEEPRHGDPYRRNLYYRCNQIENIMQCDFIEIEVR